MNNPLDRRTFLFGALAAPVLAPTIARAQMTPEKLKLGIIGCAGQGEYNWTNVADQEIVSLCDVDLSRVGKAQMRFPSAEVVQDFRRVLDRDDIDGVVISTPDHWHALMSVWAMQAGKHVYCEKPLTHSIHEARVVRKMAKDRKRVTQMGTQIHAGSNYRRVVELIQAGAIGPVNRVEVWVGSRPLPRKRVATGAPPANLDYELWLGPAPEFPYNSEVVPFHWRWWWEFGGGVLADMGCHFMDLPTWALGLKAPERVSASGTPVSGGDNNVPVEMRVDYHYPARKAQPPVHLTWFHGISGPRDEAGQVRNLHGYGSGVLFHGEKGQLLADYGRHMLLPEEQFKDFQRPAPTIPDSIGHHREWVEAIKNGGQTTCNFDYAGRLTETVLLGNVSYRLGREVRWDADDMIVKGIPRKEWEPFVKRDYRGDWKLKG